MKLLNYDCSVMYRLLVQYIPVNTCIETHKKKTSCHYQSLILAFFFLKPHFKGLLAVAIGITHTEYLLVTK